jgi:hypothetical protein
LIDLALVAVLTTIVALLSDQGSLDDIDPLDNKDTKASRGDTGARNDESTTIKDKLIFQ